MTVKRLTTCALLTAVALTIFIVELQIPTLAPIPGVKLGLANIVTVYAMFAVGAGDTAAILLSRIVLGSLFSGNMMTILYSLTGGVFCYVVMLLMRRIVTERQIWVCSVMGAIAHNMGQICAAMLVTGTPQLIAYLPVLMISGVLAGLLTGIAAQLLVNKLRNIRK